MTASAAGNWRRVWWTRWSVCTRRRPMANVLLGVTGSVAAVRVPALVDQLKERGHAVKVVATSASLYFFDPLALDPQRSERNRDVVILDEDEWSGRGEGQLYRVGEPVMHIELRRWADL